MKNARSMRTHPPKFTDIVNTYIDFRFSEIEAKRRTRENYNTRAARIKKYLNHIKKPDLGPEKINEEFILHMRAHLRHTMSVTSTSRVIELCKHSIKFAFRNGYIKADTIGHIKTPRDRVGDVIVCTDNDLEKMWAAASEKKEDEITVDVYEFQKETGMSYGDLDSYVVTADEIGEWIFNKRCKTDRKYWVPLTQKAKEIHLKYNGKVPKPKYGRYRDALRRISIKIGKRLTSHTARKTFATRMYEGGWSLESIADMMGITVLVLITHYIQKSRRRIENEIKLRMAS